MYALRRKLEHFKRISNICAKHYKLIISCLVKLWCLYARKGEERMEGTGLRMWAHQRKVHVWKCMSCMKRCAVYICREDREARVQEESAELKLTGEASSWHASHYYTRQACMKECTHVNTHTHAQNLLPNASFIARHLEWFWLLHTPLIKKLGISHYHAEMCQV